MIPSCSIFPTQVRRLRKCAVLEAEKVKPPVFVERPCLRYQVTKIYLRPDGPVAEESNEQERGKRKENKMRKK